MRSSQQPQPPTNVRAVLADGRVIPLDCVYEGRRDGQHLWVAVWVLPEAPQRLLVDELPARSAVRVHIPAG